MRSLSCIQTNSNLHANCKIVQPVNSFKYAEITNENEKKKIDEDPPTRGYIDYFIRIRNFNLFMGNSIQFKTVWTQKVDFDSQWTLFGQEGSWNRRKMSSFERWTKYLAEVNEFSIFVLAWNRTFNFELNH